MILVVAAEPPRGLDETVLGGHQNVTGGLLIYLKLPTEQIRLFAVQLQLKGGRPLSYILVIRDNGKLLVPVL